MQTPVPSANAHSCRRRGMGRKRQRGSVQPSALRGDSAYHESHLALFVPRGPIVFILYMIRVLLQRKKSRLYRVDSIDLEFHSIRTSYERSSSQVSSFLPSFFLPSVPDNLSLHHPEPRQTSPHYRTRYKT